LLKQKSKENLESKSPLLGRRFRRGKKVLPFGEKIKLLSTNNRQISICTVVLKNRKTKKTSNQKSSPWEKI
jgi:hypothetical protein